ncbi:MAG: hypothetical protein PHQ75_05530 [Thermoguttaceae bacterium]|nr:hypothetical protein [Thermoguttaceae bacterium]
MKNFVLGIVCFISVFLLHTIELSAQSPSDFAGPKNVKFVKGTVPLPNESGQIWVSYDIASYTSRFPEVQVPQRTILNWILADTTQKFWYGKPFGFLNATRENLYVYHTPKVQQYVSNVIDRFADSQKKDSLFSVRIMTTRLPDWRAKVADKVRPYPVKASDVQGWLATREDAVKIATELAARSDFRELNVARDTVAHGESFGWVYAPPVKTYIRDYLASSKDKVGYIVDKGSIDEGYRFETTIMKSTNDQQIEILFRGESTVVSKMYPIHLKISPSNAPQQSLAVELPQILHCERQEKLSFPVEQVLLLDLGMFPLLFSGENDGDFSLSNVFNSKTLFCNVLVMVQAIQTTQADNVVKQNALKR